MSAMGSLRTAIGVSAVGVIGYAMSAIEERYPPKGSDYTRGSPYIEGSKVYFVIGYTGGDLRTVENIDLSHGLYHGTKKVAQRYALQNEMPATGLVVSREWVTPPYLDTIPMVADTYGVEWSEQPLSASYMKRTEVRVVEPELVDTSTGIGKIAAFKRALQAWSS